MSRIAVTRVGVEPLEGTETKAWNGYHYDTLPGTQNYDASLRLVLDREAARELTEMRERGRVTLPWLIAWLQRGAEP